jgi:hypothetical protein
MKASTIVIALFWTLTQACDGTGERAPSGVERQEEMKMERDKQKDPREHDQTQEKEKLRREVNVRQINFTPANQ